MIYVGTIGDGRTKLSPMGQFFHIACDIVELPKLKEVIQ